MFLVANDGRTKFFKKQTSESGAYFKTGYLTKRTEATT